MIYGNTPPRRAPRFIYALAAIATLLVVLLLAGCAMAPGGSAAGDPLTARLTQANLAAGALADGIVLASQSGAYKPNPAQATAILSTMRSVQLALDGAGAAVRAGMPGLAETSLGAAQAQMRELQPYAAPTPQPAEGSLPWIPQPQP